MFDAGIIQQLILSTGGDDDMGTVLGLLQSATSTNLSLKMDIIKVNSTCIHLLNMLGMCKFLFGSRC